MDFEFAKNGEVDDVNKVPEQFRGLYTQVDGKYKLGEGYAGIASAVDGLNKSLKAARRDADEHKKGKVDLTPFSAIGQLVGLEGDDAVNPETLKSAVERIISESKDGKVNWDKMKRDLETGFNSKLTQKDGELQTMSKTLQKYLVNSAAVQAIAAHKGVPDLLLPHIAAKTKVIKEGEDYVVRVVDETGDPRGNASGGFMTIEDLVKEMKASPVFGRAFESDNTQGTGTKPGSTQQRSQQKQNEPVNGTDRIRRALEQRQQQGR
jgi:hypothetical protein